MRRLVIALFITVFFAPFIKSQCVEMDAEENRDPSILFEFTRSGATAGKKIYGTVIKSFIDEVTINSVVSILEQSNCSNGVYDFNLGTTTAGGLLEFKLADEVQLCYESIDVYANQYESSTTKYPAELSVNDSEYFPITHEPSVKGGYKNIQTVAGYGKYRFTLANPNVPLTTVKLQSTGRIVLKQLNFNLKQGTQSIESIGEDNNLPEEYFDIEGRKVAPDNLHPGLYIVKRGNATTKIIIRN